jgi:hypothetical protein
VLSLVLLVFGEHWLKALVLAAAGVVLASLAGAFPSKAEALFHTVAHAVGWVFTVVLMALVQVFVVLPVWAWRHLAGLSRLTGDGFAPVPGPRPSHPWARERRHRPTGWGRARAFAAVVVIVPVVAVGTVAAGHGLAAMRPPRRELEISGFPFSEHAQENEPWAHLLFDEQATQPGRSDPTLGFAFVDVDKPYMHVHDYARLTWTPPHPTITVWFFGGSTTFGDGQRDLFTIPSEVAKMAAADGVQIRAVNYGSQGYAAWQEVDLFKRLLKGHQAPDFAVFYHGVNDLSLTCSEMRVGLPFGTRITLSDVTTAKGPLMPRDCELLPRVAAKGMADTLTRDMGEARRAAAPSGTKVVEYLQPNPATQPISPSEMAFLTHLHWTIGWIRAQRILFPAEVADERPPPVDLTGALDHETQPVYLEYAHTNELGAKDIARALYRDLKPRLVAVEQARHAPG